MPDMPYEEMMRYLRNAQDRAAEYAKQRSGLQEYWRTEAAAIEQAITLLLESPGYSEERVQKAVEAELAVWHNRRDAVFASDAEYVINAILRRLRGEPNG